MKNRKFNNGDYLFFIACGMYLCLIGFYFSGAKDLANTLVCYVVVIALCGMGLKYLLDAKETPSKDDKTNQKEEQDGKH